ncbi:CsbD-like protein [Lentilactobacillus parafarraginis F0439]|uniref:CsbD-like protein n=1 Tax=Lentilactobacillus parafarraginis F0439 TaxID=797515 RepID=G9ZPQ0_9LACO|nr:CsbD family protein [Lentilactobacillus parafarraginis]EHL98211.1 CsbD-like protein [Lentilactobacillus parafarraginis F0439]
MSKLKNESDKVVGKTKEGLGEATGNDKMALKGKLQNAIGKAKEKLEEAKDKVAEKTNDFINKHEKKDDDEK